MARIIDLLQPDAEGTPQGSPEAAVQLLKTIIEAHKDVGDSVETERQDGVDYPRYPVTDKNGEVIHIYTIES